MVHRITSYNVCYTKLLRKNIKGKSYDAYVFDLQGKKCLYFNDLKDEIWVDASALKKGFYVLQVVGENSNKSFKINVME